MQLQCKVVVYQKKSSSPCNGSIMTIAHFSQKWPNFILVDPINYAKDLQLAEPTNAINWQVIVLSVWYESAGAVRLIVNINTYY